MDCVGVEIVVLVHLLNTPQPASIDADLCSGFHQETSTSQRCTSTSNEGQLSVAACACTGLERICRAVDRGSAADLSGKFTSPISRKQELPFAYSFECYIPNQYCMACMHPAKLSQLLCLLWPGQAPFGLPVAALSSEESTPYTTSSVWGSPVPFHTTALVDK